MNGTASLIHPPTSDFGDVMVVNGIQFDDQWISISEALSLTLKGAAVMCGDGDVLMLLIEAE